MAKSLKKIVYGTLMEIQKYSQQAYDKLPDDEYWIDKINTWRGTIIRDLSDDKYYPNAFYQNTTGIVGRLSQAGIHGGVTINMTLPVYYADIPEILDVSWKEIIFVGTDKNWSRKSLQGFNNLDGNIWTSHMPAYVVVPPNRLYIKNLPTPTTRIVKVTGIFAHPHLVAGYNYENDNYPISEAYLPKIEYLLKKEVFDYLGMAMPERKKQDEQ